MSKNFLSFVLIVSFVVIPTHTSYATETDSTIETLLIQLNAVQSYIARTFSTKVEKPLTEKELQDSIRAGVLWFKNAQEENGHFRYEYVPYEGTYRNDDNVVRQAGALYVLGEIIRKTEGDSLKVNALIERAISYFESLSREDEHNGNTFRCIVKNKSSMRCPLGATSLALIGMLDYVEAVPQKEREYRPLINLYLTYILEMQKENGGFRDTHTIGSARQNSAESAFSNGEALLALTRYYASNKEPRVKEAIDATFAYLSAQPFDNNLYLWIMAALKDMNELWPREEYVTYAKAFTNSRVQQAVSTQNSNRNYCAYAEGLASALSILEGSLPKDDYALLRNELDRLNQRHLTLQLKDTDRFRMVAKNGILGLHALQDKKFALGGFLISDVEPTERIDFTQHCLSTYVQTLVDIGRGEL